jgi:hypothetical protein
MKAVFIALFLIVLPVMAHAQQVTVTGGEVTEVGIYTAKVLQVTSTTNVIDETLEGLDGFTLLQSTTNIPARLGTRFGFRYRILGQPKNAPVMLRMVGVHPPFTNPKTGKTASRDEYQLQSWIGDTYTCYILDEDWELIPGKWTFEVWHEDKKLCEQSFMVVTDPEKTKSANHTSEGIRQPADGSPKPSM